MRKNIYGIKEPSACNPEIKPEDIDIALVPLVAFDSQGNRLGMGGGFYDRTFAYKRTSPRSRPRLIGLAHSNQEALSIDSESWDIPLEAIMTEEKFRKL